VTSLAGHVVYRDNSNVMLGAEDHQFVPLGSPSLGTGYNGWSQGKELSANYYAADGTTVLRSEATTWQQRDCTADPGQCWFVPQVCPTLSDSGCPAHDPRVGQKTSTVAGGSQTVTSKESYLYSADVYNNATEVDEYGYPSGSTLTRKTLTAYKTDAAYTTTDPLFTPPTSHQYLISLPISQTVTDGSGAVKALTCFDYDSTTGLQGASGITAHDDGLYGAGFFTRGNVTTMKQWLSGTASCSSGTFLTSTYWYDIAGNLLWMLDPRTVKRGWGYTDSGVHPTEFSGTSYAFPTSTSS
jgi:hypothetical protein